MAPKHDIISHHSVSSKMRFVTLKDQSVLNRTLLQLLIMKYLLGKPPCRQFHLGYIGSFPSKVSTCFQMHHTRY